MIPVILASNSPRRKEILQNIGLPFTVLAPDVDETTPDGMTADAMVRELSARKAKAAAQLLRERGEDPGKTLIIGADTAVVHRLAILGKPKNKKDAAQMLARLQNDTHFVTTGVTLLLGDRMLCENELTKVRFTALSKEEIDAYVKSGEAMDKAGAYGIQGRASIWIDRIEGDYFNVVGFPVPRFYRMMKQLGFSYPFE